MSEGNGTLSVASRTEQIKAYYNQNPKAKTKAVAEHFKVSAQTIAAAKRALGLTKPITRKPAKAKSTKVGKAIVAGLKSGAIVKTTTYASPDPALVLDFVKCCGGAVAAKAAIDGVANLFR